MADTSGSHARRAPEAALGPEDLAYVERVRTATARLAAREVEAEDVRGALDALADVAHFDVEAPTASHRPEVRAVKTGVKRLSAWYLRYLAAQLDAFALAALRVGDALAARTERLESAASAAAAQAETRLGSLEERVRRLEEARRA